MDFEEALAGLTTDHRQVKVLREVDGLGYDQIAGALGIPRGTVESRLFRARQVLKRAMADYSPPGAARPKRVVRYEPVPAVR